MDKLKPIPAGAMRYSFKADGTWYSSREQHQEFSSEIVFTCIAMNTLSAQNKFGKFVTSLLKQPITHV